MSDAVQQKPALSPGLKLAIDGGPLLVFFAVNTMAGLMPATVAIMVATAVAMTTSWVLARHIPMMPLVSGGLIMVFGGLTLIFDNELFIKIKPTIVNLLFASALFIGLTMKRLFLKNLMERFLPIDDEGWQKLTWRWAFFFVAMACLNEFIWRNFSTDFWVNFKVFGFFPLTLTFALLQNGVIRKHQIHQDEDAAQA